MSLKEFIDFTKFFFTFTLTAVLLIAIPIVVVGDIHGRQVCSNYEKQTGNRADWVFLDTCYVTIEGRTYRHGDYKAAVIAELGLEK